jgi:hypothetical protein
LFPPIQAFTGLALPVSFPLLLYILVVIHRSAELILEVLMKLGAAFYDEKRFLCQCIQRNWFGETIKFYECFKQNHLVALGHFASLYFLRKGAWAWIVSISESVR